MGLFDDLTQQYGLPPGLLSTFSSIESGGNPAARTGSYQGLFQLSPDVFNRYGGGNIYDAGDNARAAAAKFSDETQMFRNSYGRDPTPAELYMIHQQGWGGYQAHTANPDAPAWQNMAMTAQGRKEGPDWAKRAIWGNVPDDVKANYPGGVDSLTSRDFMELWRKKVARFSGNSGNPPMATDNTGSIPAPAPAAAPGLDPLNAPDPRYAKLAEAFMGAGINQPVRGYGDAIHGLANIIVGGAYGNRANEQQQAYNAEVARRTAAAAATNNPQTAQGILATVPGYQPAVAQNVLNREGMKLVGIKDPFIGETSKLQDARTGMLYEMDGKTPYTGGGSVISGAGPSAAAFAAPPAGQPGAGPAAVLGQGVPPSAGGGAAVPFPQGTPQGAVAPGQPGAIPPAAPSQAPAPGSLGIQQAVQAGLTGEALLGSIAPQALPDAIKARIRNIAAGNEVVQRGDPRGQQLMSLVYAYDPTFSRTDAESRFNYKKTFEDSTKKTGFTAIALNNALHHAETLADRVNLGPNHTYNFANDLSNFVNRGYYNRNLAENDKIADFLGPEMVKVASGVEGGEAERQSSSEGFKSSQGQEAIRSRLAASATIMEAKLKSLIENWHAVMGSRPIPPEILNPRAMEILAKLKGGGQTGPVGAPAAAPATAAASAPVASPTREEVEAEMRRRGLLQ